MTDRAGLYWAGRATCAATPTTCVPTTWRSPRGSRASWPGRARRTPTSVPAPSPVAELADGRRGGTERQQEDEAPNLRAAASEAEVLRHRDVAELDEVARAQMRLLLAALDVRMPLRRSSRRRPARRGELDVRRTLREELRRAGEPGPLRHRRARSKPRRVVWLVDVSGSMAPYADVLLRLAHASVRAGVGQGRPASRCSRWARG